MSLKSSISGFLPALILLITSPYIYPVAAGFVPNNACPSSFGQKLFPALAKRTTALDLTPTSRAVASVVGHLAGGLTVTPFVMKAIKKGGWYHRINLPSWTPPDPVFGPTWSVFYSIMGISVARVANRGGLTPSLLGLWLGHYALNLSWTLAFFGAKRLRLALFIDYALIASLGFIIREFSAIDPAAGQMLIPYGVWLAFVAFLNAAICRRNPTVNGYNDAMIQDDLVKLRKQAAADAH